MEHFFQLFDPESSTFTYVLADPATRDAVMIDAVDSQFPVYSKLINRAHLTIKYVIETHTHADHVTGAGALRAATGAKAATPLPCGVVPADLQLEDGTELHFGHEVLVAIATPGHTAGSMSYAWRDKVFTGDSLLIGGCGRTDFQGGDAGTLYDSITRRLFALPDETLVYPGHDYKGRTSSTIGAEKAGNPRLANRTRDEFIALMGALNLPPPKRIDVAVPANRLLGLDVHQA
jgi:glyoxylase-like metal-dependent hydrolase (beta-lactamase superfamily II)